MLEQKAPFLYTPPAGAVAVWSQKLAALPHLDAFLGTPTHFWPFAWRNVAAMAGWGCRQPSQAAHRFATMRHLPYLAVEEGFLRSLGHDPRLFPPCSLVVDSRGMYCDATRPSDLEMLLNGSGWETPSLLADARRAMDALLASRLSKYNHAPDASPYLMTTPAQRIRILLLDQAVDDDAVRLGLADATSFARMVAQAKRDHPGAALFVKPHPAVLAGKKTGYLNPAMAGPGVTFLSKDVSPHSLLAQADEVYTVTSQMGFEALLLGKKVHCFGLPFYAGWGLTRDALACPRRARRRTVVELFAAAYMLYSRYVNPITGEPCDIHEAIRLLAEQRRRNQRNQGFFACVDIPRRQHGMVRAFTASTRQSERRFFQAKDTKTAVSEAVAHKGRVLAPAERATPDLLRACAHAGIGLIRMEDGFFKPVRTNTPPASMLFDGQGRHDDFARPSELEGLLEHAAMGKELLARARNLREYMVSQGVALNFFKHIPARSTPPDLPALAGGRRIALVPGQSSPADDILLAAVRKAQPEAFIVHAPLASPSPQTNQPAQYTNLPGALEHSEQNTSASPSLSSKTSPEASANSSPEAFADTSTPGLADLVVHDVDMLALFPLVHEMHTWSSRAGFDALLRGLPVHTYGGPFYAGWGLTTDALAFPRRSRPLTLDALVAGSLILHPCYYDWRTHLFCGPEDIFRLLENGRPPRLSWRMRLRHWLHTQGLR